MAPRRRLLHVEFTSHSRTQLGDDSDRTWAVVLFYHGGDMTRVDTSHYDFGGICPASGVIASWP